jgi:hypothetical protein
MKTVRILGRSVIVMMLIGFLGLPLEIWVMNTLAPDLIRSSSFGDMDPLSPLFFMLTIILPPVACLLMTTRMHVRSRLLITKSRADVMVGKYLLGFVGTLALFPVGFFWANTVFSVLRP